VNPNAILRTLANAFLRRGAYKLSAKWGVAIMLALGVVLSLVASR
jgi:hypothetical protein